MKGDWLILYSQSLQQKIAFDKITKWVKCEDGVTYSPAEMAQITENWTKGVEIPPIVHQLKKEFTGEIISRKTKK